MPETPPEPIPPAPPAPPAPQSLLDECVDLARRAGELTLRWFRSSGLDVERKSDGTPVTAADRAAERLMREHIAAMHPDDAILGEEEGAEPGTSGRRWVLDPIDGTKAFTHGIPLYTNLLALEDTYGPLVAVVNMPALGETVYAGRGLGCFQDGQPAHVSDRAELLGSYVTTSGYDYWQEPMLVALRRSGTNMRTWGDGYGYALVATGRVEAMVDPVAATWDLAPMPLLVTEAGGQFSDISGRLTVDGGSGVATNGHVHAALLEVLAGN